MKLSDVLLGVFAFTTTAVAVIRLLPKERESVARVVTSHPAVSDLRHAGNAAAPRYVIVYHDYECPACRRLDAEVTELVGLHGDSIAVFYRHFPLESIHFQAMQAAKLAECASRQDRFLAVHGRLMDTDFEATPHWATQVIQAADVGDPDELKRCMDAPSTSAAVEADVSSGIRLGLRGTPAIIAGGRLYIGVLNRKALERAVF